MVNNIFILFYLFSKGTSLNKFDYTVDECKKLGATGGRNCCMAQGSVVSKGLLMTASTCIQLRNDKELLGSIKTVADEMLTYVPQEGEVLPKGYTIDCGEKSNGRFLKASMIIIGLFFILF